eukprot:m.15770 g.15770  ORF g.15770 m.15770 type:complete len:61 (-) comp7921_c0_seq1:539-721(-)
MSLISMINRYFGSNVHAMLLRHSKSLVLLSTFSEEDLRELDGVISECDHCPLEHHHIATQ